MMRAEWRGGVSFCERAVAGLWETNGDFECIQTFAAAEKAWDEASLSLILSFTVVRGETGEKDGGRIVSD